MLNLKKVFLRLVKLEKKRVTLENSREEVHHDKKNKVINYKNAWLQVYDKPVLYFPKFFHPDPTVKRQSGFLIPELSSSNNLGNYLSVPYFKVISIIKILPLLQDFTIKKK